MKKGYQAFLCLLAAAANLLAAAALAMGLRAAVQSGYSLETAEDVLSGRDYLESRQFQELASKAIYNMLPVMAEQSRMERGGEFDAGKCIRVRDYLDNKAVYDAMPEEERNKGICYRLGDLYQWSLKGASFDNSSNMLRELYEPVYHASIVDYAAKSGEDYGAVVRQVMEAMDVIKRDVAEYQQTRKAWSFEATNARYALWDLRNGNLYTNVPDLQRSDIRQEDLEAYFKAFGSYCIFDSRMTGVAQQNIGDYYSYNTYELLNEYKAHLGGEYQAYMGIDANFPITDEIAASARKYADAKEILLSCLKKIVFGAGILLVTLLYLLWKLAGRVTSLVDAAMLHMGAAARICVCFAAYELFQILVARLFPDTGAAQAALFLYKLAVLGALLWEGVQRQTLLCGVRAMADGKGDAHISTERLFQGNRQMAEAVNDLGEGLRAALQEQMKSERMKADLITNVSHDLKTPLTSIINYVNLMKREEIDNEKVQGYLQILDQKSQRLKQLTDDLVEASRASSGNVTLNIQTIDLKELLMQTSGEFEERFKARGLTLMENYPQESLYVKADGHRLWRIIENMFRNVEKYAMPNTRVYLDAKREGELASLSLKNISERQLNISAEELLERFVRGDESRSTEGSGLGLSIAKDLTELQKGTFDIYLDGDLFKVTVAFPWAADSGCKAESLQENEEI